MEKLPTVSLILVIRNECDYVQSALDSLEKQTYPKELIDFVLVDGLSDDGTKECLIQKAKELRDRNYSVQVFDNPKKFLAAGWNIAIKNSRADIVCRLDAHSILNSDWIEAGVSELLKRENEKIAAVGGWQTFVGKGFAGRAASYMLSSPFGVGNSPFRSNPKRTIYSDTALYALYWKAAFEEVGYFDESLERNQDLTLHSKMIQSGYKLITHPDMKSQYFVRRSFTTLFKKAFTDGLWVILSRTSYFRHRVSLYFLIYLLILGGLWIVPFFSGVIPREVLLGFTVPLFLYMGLSVFFAMKSGKSFYRFALIPLYFFYHTSYGMGSLCEVFKRCVYYLKEKLSWGWRHA